MRQVALITTGLMILAFLAGCSASSKQRKLSGPAAKLVGRWWVQCDSTNRPICMKRKRQETMTFWSHGTYSMGYIRHAGKWWVSGEKLVLKERLSKRREGFVMNWNTRRKLTLRAGKKRMVLVRRP